MEADTLFDNGMPEAEYEEMMHTGEKVRQANVIISNSLTKADIAPLAEMLVNDILTSTQPLEVAENIKVMELIIDAVKSDKRFSAYVLEELAKYGKSYTSPRGTKIEPFEGGTKYFYDKCNDNVMDRLLDEKKTLDDMIKEREKFLKAVPASGLNTFDKETGETYLIYPPYKTSTTTYKITVK